MHESRVNVGKDEEPPVTLSLFPTVFVLFIAVSFVDAVVVFVDGSGIPLNNFY